MIGIDFIRAGNAIFTIDNGQGKWYTYRVDHVPARTEEFTSKGQRTYPEAWFVKMLTGPSNESDYTYVGLLNCERVRLTQRSPYAADSLPVKVFDFAMRVILGKQELPPGYSIHHEGRCGRCGRRLTVPESIESGIGPECAKKMSA
jgi:hypothetical protein